MLFTGDLIFTTRYPFLLDADVPAWILVLRRLPEFAARAYVPGHGGICGRAEIDLLRDYLEATWARTADHLARGHSADEAAADPGYPRYCEGLQAQHEGAIRIMHAKQLKAA